MQQDIIGIVILLLALVSYALNKIPMVLTAILSMLAMYLLGILDFAEAFSGFSNNVTMMVLGMGLIGVALSQNGIMDIVANKLNSMFSGDSKLGEKQFLLIAGGIIALGSTILNPTLMVMLFLEIVDGMAARPDSPLARKFCYMPMVTASTAGCCFTSISSTTVILASGLLAESSAGRQFGFFEPMIIGLPYLLVYFLYYGTFGYKLERKFFNFTENAPTITPVPAEEKAAMPKWKFVTTLVIFVIAIGFMIFSNMQLGAIAITTAAVMAVFGCLDIRQAISKVKWETVIMVACALGFAKGVEKSGAGLLIANATAKLFGDLTAIPIVTCIIALLVANLVSQVMNNSSAAAIVVPIMILMAEHSGVPIAPVALAAGVGCNMVSATPVCAPMYTLASSVGYRFRDYFVVGGIMNILGIVACSISLYVCYFLF